MQIFLIKDYTTETSNLNCEKDRNNTTDHTRLLGIYVIESILSYKLSENPLGI